MSSILDALRQLESSGAPVPPPAGANPDRPSRAPLVAGGLVLALTAGAGMALVLRYTRDADRTRPARVAAPSGRRAPAAPAILPMAPAVPPPLVLATAEAPWARLGAPDEAAIAPPRPRERPAIAVAPAPPPPPAAPAGPPARSAAPLRVSGDPHVRLAALGYSPMQSRRTAALSVDGSSPVTLREGQSAGDVELTLILSDRVYVRHAGQVFAVHPGE